MGCESFQIFTRNQRQWTPPPLSKDDADSFRRELNRTDMGPVIAHGSYLINPASTDDTVKDRSTEALLDELARCHLLGIGYLVIHPGSHRGEGIQTGVEAVSSFLDRVYGRIEHINDPPMTLLETTAGQGKGIGHSFDQLSRMIDGVEHNENIGICLDTCHMHSAGYDIVTENGYCQVITEIKDMIGLDKVKGIHLNDSKKERGSRVDRHEKIGSGTIGTKAFSNILNDNSFKKVPMILETPGGEENYRKEIQFLMSLRYP